MLDKANFIKTKKFRDDQEYIENQRYIVEITDCETERKYYTKRIGRLSKAVGVAAEYNSLMGLTAAIRGTTTCEAI